MLWNQKEFEYLKSDTPFISRKLQGSSFPGALSIFVYLAPQVPCFAKTKEEAAALADPALGSPEGFEESRAAAQLL